MTSGDQSEDLFPENLCSYPAALLQKLAAVGRTEISLNSCSCGWWDKTERIQKAKTTSGRKVKDPTTPMKWSVYIKWLNPSLFALKWHPPWCACGRWTPGKLRT